MGEYQGNDCWAMAWKGAHYHREYQSMTPVHILAELGPSDASHITPSTFAWLHMVAKELELPMADMRDRAAFLAWLGECIARVDTGDNFENGISSEFYVVAPLKTIRDHYKGASPLGPPPRGDVDSTG